MCQLILPFLYLYSGRVAYNNIINTKQREVCVCVWGGGVAHLARVTIFVTWRTIFLFWDDNAGLLLSCLAAPHHQSSIILANCL